MPCVESASHGLVAILAASALATFDAPASAATLSVADSKGGNPYPGVLYVALPGEANAVLVTFEPDQAHVTVTDAGAIIHRAHRAPASTDTRRAAPPGSAGGDTAAGAGRVTLGDGDDRLSTAGTDDYGQGDLLVLAGPGDDKIHGGNAKDRIDGGGGVDELRGGDGWDWLSDGDRDGGVGELAPGPTCSTQGLESASGSTTASARRATVDLDDPEADGALGEGDVLLGDFEFVYGGAGNDVIAGTDRPERFIGGAGADILVGRGGDDRFRGVDDDTISCGAGNDSLRGLDGVPAWSATVRATFMSIRPRLTRFRGPCIRSPVTGRCCGSESHVRTKAPGRGATPASRAPRASGSGPPAAGDARSR